MNFAALKTEITNDPAGLGYAGKTDVQIADLLNAAGRSRIKSSMTGDEIFQQTDATEFAALTAGKQQMWVSFCARSEVNPGASANVAFVQFIFGNSSTTVQSLGTFRVETISRADEIGIGLVRPGEVTMARAM